MLKYYIKHQEEVVTRRTKYDLNKAEERNHILEGLLIALDNIDEVIALIRASKSTAEAKEKLIERFELDDVQKWILYKTYEITETISKNFDKFDVGVALTNIVSFTLDTFCDWAIELSKPAIFAGGESKQKMISVLSVAFNQILKLLHPFIPFVTENIYQKMDFKHKDESIMISQIKDFSQFAGLKKDAEKTEELVNIISLIRKFKVDNGKKHSEKVNFAVTSNEFVENNRAVIEKLSNINLEVDETKDGKTLVTPIGNFVLIEDEVDVETQKAILLKDIEKVKFEVERSSKMLSNEKFVAKAPESLVAAEKEKLAKNTELLNSLQEKLNSLK